MTIFIMIDKKRGGVVPLFHSNKSDYFIDEPILMKPIGLVLLYDKSDDELFNRTQKIMNHSRV